MEIRSQQNSAEREKREEGEEWGGRRAEKEGRENGKDA